MKRWFPWLLLVGLLLLGAYRYTPYHAGMKMYESDGTVTINTADAYHMIVDEDWEAGHLSGFTFSEGRVVDANVTSEADNTVLRIVTSAAHNLTTGDTVSITKANNAGHNKITTVTVIDGTTFDCDDITYVAGAGASSAVVDEGAYVELDTGGSGEFTCGISISGASAVASKNFKFEFYVDSSEVNTVVCEMTPANTGIGNCSGGGHLDIVAGERLFLAIENRTDTTDFNLEHINVWCDPI